MSAFDRTDQLVETIVQSESNRNIEKTSLRQQFGDYQILGEIARGGMGAVFKARHTKIDRIVALKVIRGASPGQHELDRFQSEARAAAKLNHPSIVPIFDVGVVDSEPYFTMQFINGPSLAQHLNGRPTDNQSAAKILRSISDAMSHAHEQRIIHRDLKPGNILLQSGQTPMVTDFGLAKLIDDDSNLTRTGQAVGTPAYMPPEQATGDLSKVDNRSDVYSLGAVLYTCLTGRPPFQGATPVATIMQVANQVPVSPRLLNPDANRDLQTICLKCLSKDPNRRYQSAVDLRDDLDRHLAGEPIQARPVTPIERAIKWMRRNPRSVLTIVAALCTIVGATVAIASSLRTMNIEETMNQNDYLTKSLEKNFQLLRSDSERVVYQIPQIKDDLNVRLQLVNSAFNQKDLSFSFSTWNQIAPPSEVGLEFNFVSRKLVRHSKELELGLDAEIDHMEWVNGKLCIRARYNEGQIWYLDPETFEIVDAFPKQGGGRFSLTRGGANWFAVNWQGEVMHWVKGDASTREPILKIGDRRIVAANGNHLVTVRLENSTSSIDTYDLRTKSKLQTSSVDFSVNAGKRIEDRVILVGGSSHPQLFAIEVYSLGDFSNPVLKKRDRGKSNAKFVDYAQNGSKFFVVGADQRVGVYRVNDLALINEFRVDFSVHAFCCEPLGDRVALSDESGFVHIFDSLSGHRLYSEPAHMGRCDFLCFNEQGTRLYTASRYEGSVKEFDLEALRRRTPIKGMTGTIQSVDYSVDGSLMLVCDDDPGEAATGIAITDLANVQTDDIDSQKPLGATVKWAGFTEDDSTVLAVFNDGEIHYYDTASRKLKGWLNADIGNNDVIYVALCSNKEQLAVGAGNKISIVDIGSRKISKMDVIPRHEVMGLEFCPQSGRLLVLYRHLTDGSWDAHLVDLRTGERSRSLINAHQDVAACNPTKPQVAFGHRSVMVVDSETGDQLWNTSMFNSVADLQYTRDGKRLLVLTYYGFYVIDADNGFVLLKEPIHANGFALSPTEDRLSISRWRNVKTFDIRPIPKKDSSLTYPRGVFTDSPSQNHRIRLPELHPTR